ncbi:hypothetical protein Pelo_10542 [Pelomyxa schiedti]|nr:hypothetical protein Pelo_10542 [Pelomyxa schiedti]
MATDYDYQLKLLLTGDAAVGKTSLMLRFVDDTFSDKPASPAGYDFRKKNVQIEGKRVALFVVCSFFLCFLFSQCFWYIVGYKWSREISYSDGILLQKCPGCIIVLRCYKFGILFIPKRMAAAGRPDDLGSPQVSEEMEQEFAKAHSMSAFRCSSKVGTNVKEVFNALGESVLSGLMDFEKDKGHKKTKDPVFSLDGEEGGKSKSKGKGKGKGKTKKTSKGGCLV